MKFIKYLIWFIKSDIDLETTTYWYKGKEYIDGFYFYSKSPLSKAYQYHRALELDNTYNILSSIEETIKNKKKKHVILQISTGLGSEKVHIWKGSLKKARGLLLDMIKEIQKQY